MRKIRFSSRAKRDIWEIAEYIADDDPQVVLRFVDDVEATCGVIGDMPAIGREVGYGRYAELRMMPVRRYRKYPGMPTCWHISRNVRRVNRQQELRLVDQAILR